MKVEFEKSSILSFLSKIQTVTKGGALPTTGKVLIRAKDASISMMAADMDVCCEGGYPAIVEREGAISIDAKRFLEIVRQYPEEQITIDETEPRWVDISSANVTFHIAGADTEDFPSRPEADAGAMIAVDEVFLRAMINRSLVVQGDSSERRKHVLGALMELVDAPLADEGAAEGDGDGDHAYLRICSTDGSRLIITECDIDGYDQTHGFRLGSNIDGKGILIPKGSLGVVAKFLDGKPSGGDTAEGKVNIGLAFDESGAQPNYVIFKKGTDTIYIRLFEGTFPDYTSISDYSQLSGMVVDRRSFIGMLKRMSILLNNEYRGAIFKFSNGALTVSAKNPEAGESSEKILVVWNSGVGEVDSEQFFNPAFMLDAANATISDEIVLYLNLESSGKPLLVKGALEQYCLNIIMPMRA